MDGKTGYVAFAAYNRWINRKLYAAAAGLSDEQRKRDLGAFFGSLHATLAHILLADRAWLGRVSGDATLGTSLDAAGNAIAVQGLAHVLYEGFDDLRRERERTDEAIVQWIGAMDEAALGGDVAYRNMSGAEQRHARWWAVSHMFNHQTHHRGQATTLLFQLGVDPGVTDLIAYLRNPSA